jgi:hypothetical protein
MSKHFFLTIISLLQTEFSYSPNSQLSLEPMQTTALFFFHLLSTMPRGNHLKTFLLSFYLFFMSTQIKKKQRVGVKLSLARLERIERKENRN